MINAGDSHPLDAVDGGNQAGAFPNFPCEF